MPEWIGVLAYTARRSSVDCMTANGSSSHRHFDLSYPASDSPSVFLPTLCATGKQPQRDARSHTGLNWIVFFPAVLPLMAWYHHLTFCTERIEEASFRAELLSAALWAQRQRTSQARADFWWGMKGIITHLTHQEGAIDCVIGMAVHCVGNSSRKQWLSWFKNRMFKVPPGF